MSSAFVSHSSSDDRYVQEMVQYLRTLGYDEVFNDGHTIAPDELLWTRIEKGIRECDAVVVILSHATVKSQWVDREVQFARDHGKKVIPVRIDDCKLPPSFDGRDVIDLRQGRGDKVKIATSRITNWTASSRCNTQSAIRRPGASRIRLWNRCCGVWPPTILACAS
jgi:TIR domain